MARDIAVRGVAACKRGLRWERFWLASEVAAGRSWQERQRLVWASGQWRGCGGGSAAGERRCSEACGVK